MNQIFKVPRGTFSSPADPVSEQRIDLLALDSGDMLRICTARGSEYHLLMVDARERLMVACGGKRELSEPRVVRYLRAESYGSRHETGLIAPGLSLVFGMYSAQRGYRTSPISSKRGSIASSHDAQVRRTLQPAADTLLQDTALPKSHVLSILSAAVLVLDERHQAAAYQALSKFTPADALVLLTYLRLAQDLGRLGDTLACISWVWNTMRKQSETSLNPYILRIGQSAGVTLQ